MDELFAIAGFGREKESRPLRIWLMMAGLAFAINSLSTRQVRAAEGDDSLPPGVGSLQDYMHEGGPPGQVYRPQPQNVQPGNPTHSSPPVYYVSPGNYAGPPADGTPTGSQIATGAALVGVLIVAALAYQHYQAYRQEQRAVRRYRRHYPRRAIPPPPPAFGF